MSALAFSASRTDRRQRLPIEWVIALLDDVKLIADTLTRTLREVAQVVDRTSDERDVLHFANDTKIYILGKPPIACIRYQADRRHPSVRTSGRTPTPPNLLSPAAVSEGSDLRTVGESHSDSVRQAPQQQRANRRYSCPVSTRRSSGSYDGICDAHAPYASSKPIYPSDHAERNCAWMPSISARSLPGRPIF